MTEVNQITQAEFFVQQFNKIKEFGSESFLNEWEPEEYIDSGAHGVVFRARKIGDNTPKQSAIKIIGPLDEDSLLNYKNELDSMDTLKNHPNAVHIEDYDVISIKEKFAIDYFLAIRMELLHSIKNIEWTEKEVIKLGHDMCSILSYCHNQNPPIIHCDIKPANILVDEHGNYKLGDFGEARRFRSSGTSTGFHGTPNYMSPEMYNYRGGYDTRTDLYSLGYTMYALLNHGKVPYQEYGIQEAMRRKQLDSKLPKLKNISKGLQVVICRLCHFNKDERFQSADELASVLRSPEKEQRESKSKLHAVRKLLRGISVIAIVWLVIVASVSLIIGTIEFGKVIFEHSGVSVRNDGVTAEGNIILSNSDIKSISSTDSDITHEKKTNAAIDKLSSLCQGLEATKDSIWVGSDLWLNEAVIPCMTSANDAAKEIRSYANSLGLKEEIGKFRVAVSTNMEQIADFYFCKDSEIDAQKYCNDIYDAYYYYGATSYYIYVGYKGNSDGVYTAGDERYYDYCTITVTLYSDKRPST